MVLSVRAGACWSRELICAPPTPWTGAKGCWRAKSKASKSSSYAVSLVYQLSGASYTFSCKLYACQCFGLFRSTCRTRRALKSSQAAALHSVVETQIAALARCNALEPDQVTNVCRSERYCQRVVILHPAQVSFALPAPLLQCWQTLRHFHALCSLQLWRFALPVALPVPLAEQLAWSSHA